MMVVARQSPGHYLGPMYAAILKLFTLVALALLPFGMSAAMAAPVDYTAAMSQDCDHHGGQPAEKSTQQSADCAIACSMLIPADTRLDEPLPAARLPAARLLVESGAGIHPEIATPPPKLS
jgi:hypothetical protein